ncbi:MAG: replicative DNA helicase [Bacteroidetes bacterium]|nr:MAG: replicative DNA helicase [Bacteroidota bacterium]
MASVSPENKPLTDYIQQSDQIEQITNLEDNLDYAVYFEQLVLGGVLFNGKFVINRIIRELQPESFYEQRHQYIFQAIQKVVWQAKPIDIWTVSNQLEEDGKLTSVGGTDYLMQLSDRGSSTPKIIINCASLLAKKRDTLAVPPQAVELEEVMLGAMMLEKSVLSEIIDLISTDDFYVPKHRYIFQAILQLFERNEPVDVLTVVQRLRSNNQLELVGGAGYITSKLTSKVNTAANVHTYARYVSEMAMKRQMIKVANQIQNAAFMPSSDAFELLDKAQQEFFAISEKNIRKNYADIRSLALQAIKELQAKKDHKDGLTGVPSGFTELDRITSGWQKSDLVILAARPGMGKTAMVLSMIRNASVGFKKPIAMFSLEMSSLQLVNRFISSEAEIESNKIKTGRLADYEWSRLVDKTTAIIEAPIFIDDTPALSILEFRAKARRLKSQHDIQMIIIDYLQLMSGDTGNSKGGNREQEIGMISRALKQTAKELDVPVIALSQLSRAVEIRGGDKRPQLSDLRESGSIEQDADMVIFLYRPEYYEITTDAEGKDVRGMCEVIISKHRNGSLGSVWLKFIGQFTKFEDLEGAGSNFSDVQQQSSGSSFSGIPSEFDTPSNNIVLNSKMNDFDNPFPPAQAGDFEEPPF